MFIYSIVDFSRFKIFKMGYYLKPVWTNSKLVLIQNGGPAESAPASAAAANHEQVSHCVLKVRTSTIRHEHFLEDFIKAKIFDYFVHCQGLSFPFPLFEDYFFPLENIYVCVKRKFFFQWFYSLKWEKKIVFRGK